MDDPVAKKTPDPVAARRWLTPDRLILAGLLLLTLIVRGGVLWVMRGNLQQDPDAYREIAENLLRYGEFALGKPSPDDGVSRPVPTAYRPPLYPVVLSNLPAADGRHVSLMKVAALHLALGVATVWLTWLAARRMFAFAPGPEARQEIAPTVRSGIGGKNDNIQRSEGPTPGSAETGVGPPGLEDKSQIASETPASRPGLLPGGPPGLNIAALIAGLLVACDPILLNQQTLVMTETLAAFLAILALWCLARFDAARSWFNAALAGGAMGLAVLCRPTFLPWLLFVAVTMLFLRAWKWETNRRHAWSSSLGWAHLWLRFGFRVSNALGLLIAAAAMMSPWTIRNYRVFGKPIVTTTHGGYTLLLANNPSFYLWLANSESSSLPWPSKQFDQRLETHFNLVDLMADVNFEEYRDRTCYRMARSAIGNEPTMFLRAGLYRFWQLWSPLPHKLTADESTGRRLLRYATCAWYCGVYALAAAGVWRLRWGLLKPPWLWGVLLCLAFTAVHTFYWTNLRMRAPLMPFVALLAAAGAPHRLCFSITNRDQGYDEV
jgi:hypothetical protein